MKSGIFIAGASGLLGSTWIKRTKSKFKVSGTMRTNLIAIEGVDYYEINFKDEKKLTETLEQSGAEIVINCVGFTNVDDCQYQSELAYYSNAIVPMRLALACKKTEQKFVHISTDHVFNGKNSMYTETDKPSPINVYAKTKLDGENFVLDICNSALVVRTNFFGWGLPERRSFSDKIIDALRSRRQVNLFSDAFFTPVLMDMLIEDTHQLLRREKSGVYHVVGDERISKFEFGVRLAKAFNLDEELIKPSLLSERKELARRPLDLSLDNSKLRLATPFRLRTLSDQFDLLKKSEK